MQPKFRIIYERKYQYEGYYAQVKRTFFGRWLKLELWFGRHNGGMDDARVITNARSLANGTYESADQLIQMAKLQPEIKDIDQVGINPIFNDGYRHYSADGKTVSYKTGHLLPL